MDNSCNGGYCSTNFGCVQEGTAEACDLPDKVGNLTKINVSNVPFPEGMGLTKVTMGSYAYESVGNYYVETTVALQKFDNRENTEKAFQEKYGSSPNFKLGVTECSFVEVEGVCRNYDSPSGEKSDIFVWKKDRLVSSISITITPISGETPETKEYLELLINQFKEC